MTRNLILYLTAGMVITIYMGINFCNGQIITKQLEITKQMTMTRTGLGSVAISVDGFGFLSINWGDGKENETHTLAYYYTDSTSHTITITCENIISLDCGNNQLTSLDVGKNMMLTDLDCSDNQLTNLEVSKNTALTYLDCANNQLSSSLFQSLHSRDDMKEKRIDIYGNPGAKTTERNIAEYKGWTVNW